MALHKKCLVCGEEYTKKVNCSLINWSKSKFCSHKCQSDSLKGKPTWNKGTKGLCKVNSGSFKKGVKLSEKVKQKLKGRIPWNKGKPWSDEVKKKLSFANKGHKPWNTGTSIKPEEKLLRLRSEYKEWRMKVMVRDNFTCVLCGYKSYTTIKGKSDICVDHIKSYAYHPELRLSLENGRTLCIACHRQTKTYGVNRKA